ncbi:hypothetical protein FOBAMJMH_00063 [Salmonella phage vB_SenS_ER9]|nr:hypothetical protein MELBDIBG_00058 [Salmonella phage vB_SenS_ER10]QQO88338.1 hypothetical protein GIBBNBAL_00008 [Salmonella phage vB_SenS_ER5]QQO88474.1 hypothetical protein HLLDKEJD_00008 [Salmonella phage vB_SenS_ER7]QQO88662.1 hypothetical protein FOBAMJMH_00063 [Salmonella phage vB_SenS_ER9]
MNSKDEVFEYLIDQLRQRVGKFDIVAEVRKMSIDRSITGRSGYSDEENTIIDAYIGRDSDSKQIIHNLQQHIARRDGDIRMLKDRLRRAKDKVKELRETIEHMNADFNRETSSDRPEPSEGWKENPGRKACPVPGDSEVEVEFRSGIVAIGEAKDYLWSIDNDNWDIVKYRVIK